ncbi:isopenicillin N synthase family dioxygenase [Chthonobacter albigriseus]|uniref:isopenicillin N synthase family dioxygenase n=1 Tax=Chthonobacter albigriseus TaxID=1683161 RepID=UPI0015EF30C8|nr:isopenicillin N synthase family oxygenase [Chthonobacter albigriseus]
MTDTPVHTAFQSLPIVDISGLASPDEADRKDVAVTLGKAARDCGFLYITGHGIDRDLRNRLLTQAKTFFSLPHEEKMKVYIGLSDNHRGYVPPGEEGFDSQKPDSKEGFDLAIDLPSDHPAVVAGTPMCGANQWPDLPGFREDVTAYYEAAMSLGRRLARALAVALDVPEDTFERHVNVPVSQLRLLHYPFDPDQPEDRPGIGAHTDYEIFTILLPTAPGLEVMNGDGQWIDAPPVEDAFVVNIGDMLEVWTNGALVATSHRVRKVKAERYSFPLFFGCDFNTLVEPLEVFRKPGEPTRYQPLYAGEHLWAQTMQSFAYLKKKLETGELSLPEGSMALSSFGQEAKHGAAAPT